MRRQIAAVLSLLVLPSAGHKRFHDCGLYPEAWSCEKIDFCCADQNQGCEFRGKCKASSAARHFACGGGRESSWAQDERDWCCENRDLGCYGSCRKGWAFSLQHGGWCCQGDSDCGWPWLTELLLFLLLGLCCIVSAKLLTREKTPRQPVVLQPPLPPPFAPPPPVVKTVVIEEKRPLVEPEIVVVQAPIIEPAPPRVASFAPVRRVDVAPVLYRGPQFPVGTQLV